VSSGNRTEPPTPRRLREARRRGEVAVSRDLAAATSLAAGVAALLAAGPGVVSGLAGHLAASIVAAVSADPAPETALAAAAGALGRAAAPPLVAALGAGLLAGGLQTRFLLVPSLAAPRWDRIDPRAGLRRLLSPGRAGLAALGTARALLCAGIGLLLLRAGAPALAALPRLGAAGLAEALPGLSRPQALATSALLGAFGLLDLALARRRLGRSLRMTREEVLREQRSEEGEPRLKAERRRTHRALAAAGPLRAAAVVVVNPAHLAVALAHRRGSDEAPVVLAKASGRAAARLRAQARRAGVPLVRDVALARSLFRLAEVGEQIPEELFEAAAALLVQVHGLSPGALG
jgi:type III secretion protein U